MTMDPQAQYIQLGRMVEEMPNLAEGRPDAAKHQWLGRLFALLVEAGSSTDANLIRAKTERLQNQYGRADAAADIQAILYRQLAIAELRAPASVQGAFIPAGNAFDALSALGKVFGSAEKEVFVVDPYMDHKILTEFATLAAEGVKLRLLSDQSSVKSSLRPAYEAWVQQNGAKRPLEGRLSRPKELHDRLLVIDGSTAWILTQSLNAFATRSPASINRSDSEVAALKIPYYEAVWAGATPLA